MNHLVKLAGSPRYQDIYSWLSYRLPQLKKPLHMPYDILQGIFGEETGDPYKFRQTFRKDLRIIDKVYDGFRIDTPARKDYLTLNPSNPPIPKKITPLITK